jgi:hypothetical protein
VLHDSGGERRFQVVSVAGACHLPCSVTVLDARMGADVVKCLNWLVDLREAKRVWVGGTEKETERERER